MGLRLLLPDEITCLDANFLSNCSGGRGVCVYFYGFQLISTYHIRPHFRSFNKLFRMFEKNS